MDYGYIDVPSTSQGCPIADTSFGVTYRTIRERSEDVRTSSGRKFAKWITSDIDSGYKDGAYIQNDLLHICLFTDFSGWEAN